MADELRRAIEVTPAVVLTGARQVGKSTLLRNEVPFSRWRYLNLDDHEVLRQAREEPRELWAGAEAVVIDEAQRAPDMLMAIKREIDEGQRSVRFALSGSANLLLMGAVSETLAGRAAHLRLGPLVLGEMRGSAPPRILQDLLAGQLPEEASGEPCDPYPFIQRGLMPGLLNADEAAATRWWDGYAATYLERDLRQLSQIESLTDFRRLMEAVALRSGSVLNQTDVGREIGLPQPTVHRYLNLLETSHVLTRVPGYTVSRTQRLSKRPKAYLFDTGAASYLCGLYGVDAVSAARERGGLFESLVLQQLTVLAGLMSPAARIHYWRTSSGSEVDLVLERGHTLLAVEVKLTARPGFDDVTRLREFLKTYGSTAAAGVLLHTGGETIRLGERIIALPWNALTE